MDRSPTRCSQMSHISSSQHWNCFNTGALSKSQTLEFGLERTAVPGPTGSSTLELLFLLLGPGPLPTDFPETPGPANGHVPLGTTGEGAASTSSPLFFVLLNPISMWDILVWMDKTPTQAAAEAMPYLGTLVPKPGVTNDQHLPTFSVVGSVFVRSEAACAELPGQLWSQCQPLPRCAALAKPGVPCRARPSPWEHQDLCPGRISVSGERWCSPKSWDGSSCSLSLPSQIYAGGIWDILLLQVLQLLNY